MIKIKAIKTSSRKRTPYYLLVFNYMIGDANGDTRKSVRVSVDNPYVERFCKLLNKLKPLKGSWGICFRDNYLEDFLKCRQIKKDDFEFLRQTMYKDVEGEVNLEEKHLVFYEGITGETEYSFLVFEGVDLYYFDEFGLKHETEIK